MPPLACRVWLYAVPMDPPGSDVVVTLRVEAVMVMLRFAVAVFFGDSESVTVTVKFTVPVSVPVGVPEIAPVVAFKLNPAGKLPVVTAQV
jgi:hypothetical protein